MTVQKHRKERKACAERAAANAKGGFWRGSPIKEPSAAGGLGRRDAGRDQLTLGLDLSGVVEAVRKNVTSVAVGDMVYGYSNMMRQGAYAEYAW